MQQRIIYVTHWKIPSEKTMSPLILKTCEAFIKEGYAVELWTRSGGSKADAFAMHDVKTHFPIRRIPVLDLTPLLGRLGFLLMVVSFNVSVFFALLGRHEEEVILYGHDLRDFVVPGFLNLPLFVEIHDFYESGVRWINRFVLSRTTGLIVTNSIKMRRLHEAYGFPLEQMLRQPNAVNAAQFDVSLTKEEARTALGLPHEQKIALYTGHLFSWKGVHTLAEAAAFMPEDMRVYFVGGTAPDRHALEKFVKEKALPRIVFVEHQPHTAMPLFQKAADILVLPNTAKEVASKYETSPVKLFEYLASGRPIVVSDIPSIREVVSEKEVYFFTPDDPRSLAQTVSEALEGRDGARLIAAKQLAYTYTWEERAKRIVGLLRACSPSSV